MAGPAIPFDATRLDSLMDETGMDVLLATSKHNVRSESFFVTPFSVTMGRLITS